MSFFVLKSIKKRHFSADNVQTIKIEIKKKLKPLYINDFSLSEDGPSGET